MRLQPGVVMPGGIVPAASSSRTYAQFVANVTAKTPNVEAGWQQVFNNAGLIRVYANNNTLTTERMDGSPWTTVDVYNAGTSHTCRVMQHALPSEAVFNQQRANSAVMLVDIYWPIQVAAMGGLSRNGYTSQNLLPAEEDYNASRMTLCAYWDFAQGAAFQMNPSAGTGPVPYVW